MFLPWIEKTETLDEAGDTFYHQGAKFFQVYFILFLICVSTEKPRIGCIKTKLELSKNMWFSQYTEPLLLSTAMLLISVCEMLPKNDKLPMNK